MSKYISKNFIDFGYCHQNYKKNLYRSSILLVIQTLEIEHQLKMHAKNQIESRLIFICLTLLCLHYFCTCEISYTGTVPELSGSTYYSFQIGVNHIVALKLINGSSYAFTHFKTGSNITQVLINVPAISFQIRTTYLNIVQKSSQYLIFNSTYIYTFTTYFTKNKLSYQVAAANTSKILDAVFNVRYSEAIVVLQYNNAYSLNFLMTKVLKTSLNLNIPYGVKLAGTLFESTSYVYMHWQGYAMVYLMNPTTHIFSRVFFHNYTSLLAASPNYSGIDLDIQPIGRQLFLYSTPAAVHIVNITTWAIIHNYTFLTLGIPVASTVLGCKFINSSYIIMNTNSIIYEVDIDIGMVIATRPTTLVKNSVVQYSSASRQIMLIDKVAGTAVDFYLANSSYWCKALNLAAGTLACTACNSTYALQATSYCLKSGHTSEIGEIIAPVFYNPNNSVNIVSTAAVLNTTYLNTTTTSTTVPATSTPVNQSVIATKQEPKNYAHVFNTSAVENMATSVGKTLSFASMKGFTPKFLLALACLLDDLWYYQYHRKDYPLTMKAFLVKIDLTNQLRFIPWYIEVNNFMQSQIAQDHMFQPNEIQYYTYVGFNGTDPDSVYFLHTSADTYRLNFIMNFATFLLLKVAHLVFYGLKNKCSVFKYIHSMIKESTKWWTLIIACLEPNMIKLGFQCTLQLFIPSMFQFMNKVNFVATLVMFLSLLLYSFCFYILTYTFAKKKQSQNILSRCSPQYSAFLFQPCLIIVRSFVRAFIHGFYINNYQIQVTLLFISDIPPILFTLRLKSAFMNIFTLCASLCYAVTFACFDFYFLLEAFSETTENSGDAFVNRELTTIILISLLLIFTLLISLSLFGSVLHVGLKFSWAHIKKCRQKMTAVSDIKNANSQNKKNKTNLHQQSNKSVHSKLRVKTAFKIKLHQNQKQQSQGQVNNYLKQKYDKTVLVKLRKQKQQPRKHQNNSTVIIKNARGLESTIMDYGLLRKKNIVKMTLIQKEARH